MRESKHTSSRRYPRCCGRTWGTCLFSRSWRPRFFSIPLARLDMSTGPGVQGETLRELRDAVHAHCQHSDPSVNVRLFVGNIPILGGSSLAAEFEGESAETSIMGFHLFRGSQALRLKGGNASLGRPTKGTRKFAETAREPAAIREYMDSGTRLDSLSQSNLSVPWGSSGLK